MFTQKAQCAHNHLSLFSSQGQYARNPFLIFGRMLTHALKGCATFTVIVFSPLKVAYAKWFYQRFFCISRTTVGEMQTTICYEGENISLLRHLTTVFKS